MNVDMHDNNYTYIIIIELYEHAVQFYLVIVLLSVLLESLKILCNNENRSTG